METATNYCSETLTERWHDAVLDLESLLLDRQANTLVFRVRVADRGRSGPVCAIGSIGVFRVPLAWCHVTVEGAREYCVAAESGESEIFVSSVRLANQELHVSGMNGELDVQGEAITLTMRRSPVPNMEVRELRLPVGEFSWVRRKRKKGETHT